MEELLHHLDQEYLQTVFVHTSQQLDSSMRKLENKRNAVETLVTDTLSELGVDLPFPHRHPVSHPLSSSKQVEC
ncbi:hypothetical protein BLNAU_24827 [Blattamonas nauphoetae]|uniref:Uncharacterized protein n=1 Tax=Blattamonas nauphoetae TaxID=2049346 RepID=A0ABQ9WNE0_9EUKA|nr:hypothetical protein BLNAU_24827 [Blattamonas nauphoetae]